MAINIPYARLKSLIFSTQRAQGKIKNFAPFAALSISHPHNPNEMNDDENH